MNSFRKNQAWIKRNEANLLANQRPTIRHKSNGDELKFRDKNTGKPSYLVSYTKGLPHDFDTGLIIDPDHFTSFVRAIDTGNYRDFRETPLGPYKFITKHKYLTNTDEESIKEEKIEWESEIAKFNEVGLRAWESKSAGIAFALEGPDAQAVTMPPAPILGSAELTGEIAEVYVQALLRDVPFTAFSSGLIELQYLGINTCNTIPKNGIVNKPYLDDLCAEKPDVEKVLKYTEKLKELNWFSNKELKLNHIEKIRRCNRQCPSPSTAFRGITKGDDVGPYLSQFLLIGNNGISEDLKIEEGKIKYGAITIEQKVRTASPINYMTKWEQWFDVQNAANVANLESYETAPDKSRRFIYTPRDLATYVHFDALYEAYLNACLILLGRNTPFDPGIPFQQDNKIDHQQGFAHFGGPHILTLVTEVATRALKAVRFQKYAIHRRCRPEVLAARITKADILNEEELSKMKNEIGTGAGSILESISTSNGSLYESKTDPDVNYLLPMPFTEGSPMHPAYGAGHATVAGACVTVLKAFFDCNVLFKADGQHSDKAYVSVEEGTKLKTVPVFDKEGKSAHLTVEGELNKLASNISIGRNWAGVHYFTDYYESILLGEQIAIGILEEQKLLFNENFSMSIPLFGGETIRI
ncbi:vanadium-dependent haloperoxidase [Mangrovimonas sp. TPBH4]|uniref:vanadium-dependent haloperoxidase n=1 Tax=Mangrovimonas sp. TPBH4 TaxID=1645914 RepID=UPI0006B5B007|nr:vanadium-dependent haloperoxidase [Mangrovimonas sp. TPBH4]